MSDNKTPPATSDPMDMLAEIVRTMMGEGARHAELRITFSDVKVSLLVTLASVEYADGRESPLRQEATH